MLEPVDARPATPGPRAWYEPMVDLGLVPDVLLRLGIRSMLRSKLRAESIGGAEGVHERKLALIDRLRTSPIAIQTRQANEQHYELPPEFFELFLGPNMKYSSGYWPAGVTTLEQAERAMLDLYVQRADVRDGMRVLDLGCGWGSLSLHLARALPGCSVLGVSNSAAQRRWIERRCQSLGITNVRIVTADANTFSTDERFDRILSIEMFEHMKNYEILLRRLASMLRDDGRLFVHIFTHRELAYQFERDSDWMTRYFFAGGTMPSDDLLLHFQHDVELLEHWRVGGEHYGRTAEAWLSNLDDHRPTALYILRRHYGPDTAEAWFNRWRLFLMACAELWSLNQGSEWMVSHYAFAPRPGRANAAPCHAHGHRPAAHGAEGIGATEIAPAEQPHVEVTGRSRSAPVLFRDALAS